jgi:dihydrofolate reductase
MAKVFLEISMSLDGFVAGPEVSMAQPMGLGGQVLHHWMFGDGAREPTAQDLEMAGAMFEGAGAILMGRRTFDLGIDHWGEDGAFLRPCIVVTHRGHERIVRGATQFIFVTGGTGAALAEARSAAGDKKDICIMGGAELARQYLARGEVQELRIHLAHVLLGAGTPLFDPAPGAAPETRRLAATQVVDTPFATHFRFRVRGSV